MNTTLIAVIVIAALVVIGVAVMITRKREGERLKEHFGPEYDRQVREAGGSTAKAEAELAKRQKRIEKLDIRPLPPAQPTLSPRTGRTCRPASSTIPSVRSPLPMRWSQR